jgi:hypothetical protein
VACPNQNPEAMALLLRNPEDVPTMLHNVPTMRTVVQSQVFVYCILDGRRDLQDLLEERLLR